MKENIIIIGTVGEISKYKYIIEHFYYIVATIDHLNQGHSLEGYEAIRFEEINTKPYDLILLICGREYYEIMYPVLTGALGVNPSQIGSWKFLDGLKYQYDRDRYEQLYSMQESNLGNFQLKVEDENKVLADYRANAGVIDLHYFFQDMMVASQIIKKKVSHHWDIGSRLDGFVSHLLAGGINTTVIDIRPFQEINIGYGVANLNFIQADATDLSGIPDGAIRSLSALHSVEHFGLGRYGDEINPDAWKRALQNMSRVLATNGTLYLSVPVGQEEKLCFNAHRIFYPQTICEALGELRVEGMYLVHNGRVKFFDGKEIAQQDYFAYLGDYDCGIFIFVKEEIGQKYGKKEDIISVVVPCYNVEEYINRCLKSIEDQTWGLNRLEVILVDDASTDGTLTHLLAFEKRYPDNVVVVSCEENIGPGAARNIGMGYATGTYLTFIDADDKVDAEMLRRMHEKMEEYDCEVVECGYSLFTEAKEFLKDNISNKEYFQFINTGRERGGFILNSFKSAVWGRLYRKNYLEKCALCFPDGIKCGEDNFFSGLVMLTCRSYYHIEEPLYYYYCNANGIMGSCRNKEKIRQINEVMGMFLSEIHRRGFLDGVLDECACEFEWYMIYKYFIDPVKSILSAKESDWQEQVCYFRNEILKFLPEAYHNAYLKDSQKWEIYGELLKEDKELTEVF